MIPPSFTPFSDDGMSIITAMFLFFASIICGMFAKWVIDKNMNQDVLIKDHSEKIQDTNLRLTRIEGNVDTTKTIVQRIDDSMTELGKTNQYLIKHILEK